MILIKKITVIFLPSSIMLIILFIISIMANEIYLFGSVVASQEVDELYGIGFSDYNVEYKLSNLVKRNPEIAVIGTSRVMQFRKDSFESHSFYNAGGVISQVGHLRPILNYLLDEDAVPEIIIVGLDQYFFNAKWDLVRDSDAINYESRLRNTPVIVLPNRIRLIIEVLNQPESFINVLLSDSNNIGLQGKLFNQGFRYDGSYYYGRYYEYGFDNDPGFEDTLFRIEYGINRFEFGQEYNVKAMEELGLFLALAAHNNIKVVGFMPPFAPMINDVMSKSGEYLYITKASVSINNLFEEYGFNYYDFTSMPETFDANFIDGFHGDDYIYSEIASEIANFLMD